MWSVPVASSVAAEPVTQPLTKDDLVAYLASGCKPRERWRCAHVGCACNGAAGKLCALLLILRDVVGFNILKLSDFICQEESSVRVLPCLALSARCRRALGSRGQPNELQ
jgi:hypothetical protein